MGARLPPKLCLVTAAITGTIAITACGASSNPNSAQTGTGSTVSASLVKFSACMRSNGVSRFPDPSTSQGPNSFGVDGYNFNLPSNLNSQSPAYEAANKTCFRLIDSGTSKPRNPAFLTKARQAALANAQCMREHGVPSFPDPHSAATAGASRSAPAARESIPDHPPSNKLRRSADRPDRADRPSRRRRLPADCVALERPPDFESAPGVAQIRAGDLLEATDPVTQRVRVHEQLLRGTFHVHVGFEENSKAGSDLSL